MGLGYGDWKSSLERSKWMTEKDKELFLKFAEDAVLHQIGARRIEKYRTDLSICRTMTGKTLHAMLDNIQGSVAAINASKRYMPATKKDCKRTLGSIYIFRKIGKRSLKRLNEDEAELFKHKIKVGDSELAKPVILREEMREIASYGDAFDKAVIYLLFESGMRAGEFLPLKKSDLSFSQEGLDVNVPKGKTGRRRITVVEAASFVSAWLESHPIKKGDSPVWITPYKKRSLSYPMLVQRICHCAEKMNEARKKEGLPPFRKPVNPHNFRHSRATELGAESGMTEQIMDKYFGWEIGSNMSRVYLHLTDEQVKKAVLKTYGKAKPEEDKRIITERFCQRCKEKNPLKGEYCWRCGSNLDSGKVVSNMLLMEEKVKEMEKKQEAQNKEMENLARKLAALTVDKTKRGLKGSL